VDVPDLLAMAIKDDIRANGVVYENGLSFLTEKTYPEFPRSRSKYSPTKGSIAAGRIARLPLMKGR
jgi:hypothetical protein